MHHIISPILLTIIFYSTIVTSHPGHGGLHEEIAERAAYFKRVPRDLSHCAEKLRARGIHDRFLSRRKVAAMKLQEDVKLRKRSLIARQASSSSLSSGSSAPTGSPPSSSGGGNGTMGGGSGGGGGSSSQNLSTFGSTVLNTSHLYNTSTTPSLANLTLSTLSDSSSSRLDSLFSTTNNHSCVLNPEATIGPYYVSGEYIRSDITDSQPGIPLFLYQQYIDISTCTPIPDLYAEIWHCNSTGVYSGIVATGNGDSNDASNINNTFLRGIQPTDTDGIVRFETVFPGYYSGRTTHVHMVTHTNASVVSSSSTTTNKTVLSGGNVTHIGQLFFDQTLINDVNENVYPYSENTQTMTTNEQDSVFIGETSGTSNSSTTTGSSESITSADGKTYVDPIVDYIMLGDDYEDGIFAWATIGVDVSASYEASAAAVLTDGVGVATDKSSSSGPGGSGGMM